MSPARLLTIDRGNSTLDVQWHGEPPQRVRFSASGASVAREFAEFVGGWRPSRCLGATVVPSGLDAAASALAERGLRLEVAGADLPCPLDIDYDPRGSLGADRWLGALAAHRMFGAAVVVDCGTATTVNLVTASGRFLGGAIAPGLSAMRKGMALVTPLLPAPDEDLAVKMPARRSRDGVTTGLLLAFCGAVDRLFESALRRMEAPCVAVVTGGAAAVYLRHGSVGARHVDDLVHRGLAILAEGS
ncbi:MAG: hypothetical protein Fur0037_07590 [Planctomycetota bacterium]